MAEKYEIPFGADARSFFDTLNLMDGAVDELGDSVDETNKSMQKGFDSSAAAGDRLAKQLEEDAKKVVVLKDQAKALGKEIGEALSGKNVGNDLEKKVQKFNDLLGKFSTNANKPIKFNIDSAKLEQFEKALANGADELQVFAQVIDVVKQELATMDPNTQEFKDLNAQLEISESFLTGLGAAAQDVEVKNKSLKTQLRDMKAALAELEMQGKENTAEFLELSIAAGQVEDQIGDISARVRVLASDTKYIDAGIQAIQGIAGAFAAAQGAAALFGSENEEVNRVIQKVTGAMAVLQGIQAVANALNKDSALSVLLFSNAQKGAAVSTAALASSEVGATAATRALNLALLSNPIFLVIAALAAVVTALVAFSDGSDDAEQATARLNAALEDQEKLLDLNEAGLKRRTDLLVAQAKATGATETAITNIEGQALQERLKLRETAFNQFVKLYNDQTARAGLSADENKKIEEDLIAKTEELADLRNEISVKGFQKEEQLRKAGEDADKKAIENSKKRADERKQILEQQIKYTADLEKERVNSIVDEYDRERAAINQAAGERIAGLEREKSLSVKAEEEKQALIKQIKANQGVDIKAVDEKQAADLAALQFKARELMVQYQEEGVVKEIETIRLGYDEKRKAVSEEYAKDADMQAELIGQLNEAQARETKKVQDAATNEAIAAAEERAILEIETATEFLPDLPKIEEQKQIEILKVKLEYAQKAMQALLDQGEDENSVAVLKAKKLIQDLQKGLGEAVADQKKGGGVDMFELLGLGDLSDDQKDAVRESAQIALDSVTEITDFIIDQYQRQIDAKQESIDQIDSEIDDLEAALEREKQLRDEGFANNVGRIEEELAAKQKARDAEIKQQEELQKKQQAIAKAQVALDTIVQASNLITAATSIFKSLAGIPIVGIPLAIATVALMTGAFIATRIKAFQLAGQQKQSFGEGGWIDGESHARGGKKYVSADGTGDVVELEGGEHVTRKSSAAKYADLLEAINKDELSGMNEDALRGMLEGLGISLSTDAPLAGLKAAKERDGHKQNVLLFENSGPDYSEHIKTISENVNYLADKERARVERWEDELYFYEKHGTKTVRIKKP